MRRYQLYLDPKSINVLDEVAEVTPLRRSELIRAAIDGAALQVGNLLAVIKPPKVGDFSWLDSMIGSIIVGKKKVKISENIDEIYYR